MQNTKKKQSKTSKLPKLTIQQQLDNQQIIERMNRKITYSKNRRYLGQTLLYTQALQSVDVKPNANFKAEPDMLFFTDYEANRVYEAEIRLINDSKTIQRIKLTPLKNKQFVIANVHYPNQNTGDIAPGMCVIVSIRFRPIALVDYEDQLIVIIADGLLKIPITAQRVRWDIGWPKRIDCDHCWVGNNTEKTIPVVNRGGEAQFKIVGAEDTAYTQGYFEVSPSTLKFDRNSTVPINVTFNPKMAGNFKENIVFKSQQGEEEEVVVELVGGAYTAKLTLEGINGEKVKEQKLANNLYLRDCEMGKQVTSSFDIKNQAVVDVDYFWVLDHPHTTVSDPKGTIKPANSKTFTICYDSAVRVPETVRGELYLYNLPEESLQNNMITKVINGVKAIQCLVINIKTSPNLSQVALYPLHRVIQEPLYQGLQHCEEFTIFNSSETQRTFCIQKICEDEYCQSECLVKTGVLAPNSEFKVSIQLMIKELVTAPQKASYLFKIDNGLSKTFSIEGRVSFPELSIPQNDIYFGLCRTYTHNTRQLKIKNNQGIPVKFKLHNQHRYYVLDFYDFYEFESDQFYKDKLKITDSQNGRQLLDWIEVRPQEEKVIKFQLSVYEDQSIELPVRLEVMDGQTKQLNIIAEVQELRMELSRPEINLKEIYKGNVYNSNKFLSKQLQIRNKGNIDAYFQIVLPETEACIISLDPLEGMVPKKSTVRLDLIIEPIKTGQFCQDIKFKFYDDLKVNPQRYNQPQITFNAAEGRKKQFFHDKLGLKAVIKGVDILFFLKDEARAKKIRVKVQDNNKSLQLSSYSHSSKSNKNLHHQAQKIVYPNLTQLNFYNCEINMVRQQQIIIENDSGLTAEFQIRAQNFFSLQKVTGLKKTKGFISTEEEAFTSEMGKQFLKARVLDKSQKVHLSNNKGISITCQPNCGILHKKQSQRIMITMFNDTSGRFRDNLLVSIKDHKVEKFPVDIHIKGTPVSLSRNQLGINFNEIVPTMSIGTVLKDNGTLKKSIKVVNNGPKEVELNWLIYPHNQFDREKDLFQIHFTEGDPGSSHPVTLKWEAIKPEIDHNSPFSIEPTTKKVKGRQEVNFTLNMKEVKQSCHISNLLICDPILLNGDTKIAMESLAVVIETEAVDPILKMDLKHKNHVNKLEKFAINHEEEQTNSKNNQRNLRLKNPLRANLSFTFDAITNTKGCESFKIVSTSTDSALGVLQKTAKGSVQTSFILPYESFVDITIELLGNCRDLKEWPMEQKIRRDGQLVISFSNGVEQKIELVGWLYRPWVQLQMPNDQLFLKDNFEIDFGTVHVKNNKKLSLFLINPTKVDAKWTISYLKYHQSIKYKFEQSLWTAQDYEDQTIVDEKRCFRLSQDGGLIRNRSIPVHYIPGTLALPSQQDYFTQIHKPVKVDIAFKPENCVLYKSKFKINIIEGPSFEIVVKGRGSFEEELQKK